jgi:hypothetical protein
MLMSDRRFRKGLGVVAVGFLACLLGVLSCEEATTVSEIERTPPLVIIDGEIVEGLEEGDLERVNALDIDHIEILKEGPALEKYGEKGKDGVIEITTMSGGGAERLKKLREKKKPGEGDS